MSRLGTPLGEECVTKLLRTASPKEAYSVSTLDGMPAANQKNLEETRSPPSHPASPTALPSTGNATATPIPPRRGYAAAFLNDYGVRGCVFVWCVRISHKGKTLNVSCNGSVDRVRVHTEKTTSLCTLPNQTRSSGTRDFLAVMMPTSPSLDNHLLGATFRG